MALTGRRFGRENSRALNRGAIGTILFLAAGRPVFTEREYTVVAGTVVDVFDLSDQTRTHVVTQADPAKQVLPPAAHADFGGRPCYDFTGAPWYQSNRSTAYWAIMHNAGGSTHLQPLTPAALTGTTAFAGTTTGGSASAAGSLICQTTAALRWIVGNGSANMWNSSAAAALAVNTPTYIMSTYREGASPEWTQSTGATLRSSGTAVPAPTAGASQGAFAWGASSNGTLAASFRSPGTMVFPGLDAAGESSVRTAMQKLYGLTA